MTVPDPTNISLRQMVQRMRQGLEVSYHKGEYYGQEIPDLFKLDISERHDLLTGLNQRLDEINKTLSDKQKEAATAAAKKAFDDSVEQAVQARLANNQP